MERIIFGFMLLGLPSFVSAHTRWFAEADLDSYVSSEPTVFYLTVCLGLLLLAVLIAVFLHQKNYLRLAFLRPKAEHAYERAAATFAMITGSFFVIAGTHEYLFSPNQTYESGIPYVLIVLQILIGLAFMLGIGTRSNALLLMLVWSSTFYFAGFVAALENVWVFSTALFIAIMGNDYFSLVRFSYLKEKFQVYNEYALSLLRLGTGLTLVVLGLSEKIMQPQFGVDFLSKHDWNFMQTLGFSYSDYLFVLSAGTVEVLFGLIFILGIMTRLNALVAAIVFTIPLFILGPIELAGHIPHFAAIVLLLLFGSGGKFLFFKKYRDVQVAIGK